MNKVIALDGDGVLLDYHAAYRLAWQQAFGHLPELRDPQAYWPMDRWNVPRLEPAERAKLRACMNDVFWSSIPAIPGAIQACQALSDAGYELVCLTAIDAQYQSARLKNLQNHGFPIESVIATPIFNTGGSNPKAEVLKELLPVAFVDDFLPFMIGLPAGIHAALVLREPNGSPNVGADLDLVHSQHANLSDFAAWWLCGKPT